MKNFIVKIETTNAAFEHDPHAELIRCLQKIIYRLEDGGDFIGRIKDTNGNTCGQYYNN